MEKITTTIRLRPDIKHELWFYCQKHNVRYSDYIEAALLYFFDLEPEKPFNNVEDWSISKNFEFERRILKNKF